MAKLRVLSNRCRSNSVYFVLLDVCVDEAKPHRRGSSSTPTLADLSVLSARVPLLLDLGRARRLRCSDVCGVSRGGAVHSVLLQHAD